VSFPQACKIFCWPRRARTGGDVGSRGVSPTEVARYVAAYPGWPILGFADVGTRQYFAVARLNGELRVRQPPGVGVAPMAALVGGTSADLGPWSPEVTCFW